jgi:hypothetical protein
VFLRWQLERHRGRRGRPPRSLHRLRRQLGVALEDAVHAARDAIHRKDGRTAGALLTFLRETGFFDEHAA